MRSIAFDYLSCRCLLFPITNIQFIYYMIFRKIWKTSKRKVYLWIINFIDFFPMTFHRLISGIEWEKWKSFRFLFLSQYFPHLYTVVLHISSSFSNWVTYIRFWRTCLYSCHTHGRIQRKKFMIHENVFEAC